MGKICLDCGLDKDGTDLAKLLNLNILGPSIFQTNTITENSSAMNRTLECWWWQINTRCNSPLLPAVNTASLQLQSQLWQPDHFRHDDNVSNCSQSPSPCLPSNRVPRCLWQGRVQRCWRSGGKACITHLCHNRLVLPLPRGEDQSLQVLCQPPGVQRLQWQDQESQEAHTSRNKKCVRKRGDLTYLYFARVLHHTLDFQYTINGLHPFSRYTIYVKAVPPRRIGLDSVESSKIEVNGSKIKNITKRGNYSVLRWPPLKGLQHWESKSLRWLRKKLQSWVLPGLTFLLMTLASSWSRMSASCSSPAQVIPPRCWSL